MELETKIKSIFGGVSVEVIPAALEVVEVVFTKSRGSVVVTKLSENEYSASYPKLVRDNRGGYKLEDGFSSNMHIEGVFWILKQIEKHGQVKPEIID